MASSSTSFLPSFFNSDLPGFRFIPTDVELVNYYLEKKVRGELRIPPDLIIDVEFYSHDPWDLSHLASAKNNKFLYFFVPRDRTKHRNGTRQNRLTRSGYWKATGTDHRVRDSNGRLIGFRKTLVFYTGRAPRGNKTNWVMNEYRLPRTDHPNSISKEEFDVTLCRLHQNCSPLQLPSRVPVEHACNDDAAKSCNETPSMVEDEKSNCASSSGEENSAASSSPQEQPNDEFGTKEDISQLLEWSNFEVVLPELKTETHSFDTTSWIWPFSPQAGMLVTPRSGHYVWERQCPQ